MMYHLVLYDFRFGSKQLVFFYKAKIQSSIDSKGYLLEFIGFSYIECFLLVYVVIGSIFSIFTIFNESLKFVRTEKIDKKSEYERLQEKYPETKRKYIEKKLLFIRLKSKLHMVVIKPNIFQIASNPILNLIIALCNFVVLLIVLIIRIFMTWKINNIDQDSPEYVNLLSLANQINILVNYDAINMFLIFFSLFYYTAQSTDSLRRISRFFSTISTHIAILLLFIGFGVFSFGLAFFYFNDQYMNHFNSFPSTLVSIYSLSFGMKIWIY